MTFKIRYNDMKFHVLYCDLFIMNYSIKLHSFRSLNCPYLWRFKISSSIWLGLLKLNAKHASLLRQILGQNSISNFVFTIILWQITYIRLNSGYGKNRNYSFFIVNDPPKKLWPLHWRDNFTIFYKKIFSYFKLRKCYY